jgi:lactate racemase
MNIHLRYGRNGLDTELPDGIDAHILRMAQAAPVADPDAAVRHALANPIASEPLSVVARGKSSAAITISDITRPVPNAVLLPPILDTLNGAGIPDVNILVVVGTGLHRPNTKSELREMVGDDILRRVEIVNHVARDESTLMHLGETPRGTPVWINRAFVEADLHIATSLIEPHLMAGFSGGRKAICPGMAGAKTMRIMHGPTLLSHELACEGHLEGNPFHEEATEIARMVGVDFIVNTALNENREVTGVFAGDLEAAHTEGCRFVAEQCSAELPRPADIILTTSAGYPLDLTFYQSVKAMTAALPGVKPGGTVIVAAACNEGIGSPEYTQLMAETTSVEQFRARISDPDFFVIDQWQTQEMCRALDKVDVLFYTDGLPADTIGSLLVTPVESVRAGLDAALHKHGQDALVAVIPDGPYVLPRTLR